LNPALQECRAAYRFVSLAVAYGVLLHGGGPGASSAVEEYHLKAAFLFHFAQLVDWPASAFVSDSSPLVLCTTGGDVFHGDLEAVVAGKQIATRSLRVLHLKASQQIQGCHVLFIGGVDHASVAPMIARLKDASVLTVGEIEGFVDQGGMIGFVLEGKKVRFDINLGASQRVRLKIGSRLLLLARSVIGSHE
jgi:YfiR/HmsC-like